MSAMNYPILNGWTKPKNEKNRVIKFLFQFLAICCLFYLTVMGLHIMMSSLRWFANKKKCDGNILSKNGTSFT